MNAQLSPSATESPAETIARVEATGKRIDTPCGDGTIVWRQWGNSGPWLFLLHGNFGSWKHWIRNVEALGRHYRTVAVDIPGFGESAEPTKPYSAQSLADVMAAGIRAISGDEQIYLAGFSFGGAVSSELAYVLGEKVRKLVWISSGRNTGMTRGKHAAFVKWREMKTHEEREAAHRRNLEIIMIAEPSRVDALAVHIQSQRHHRRGSLDEDTHQADPVRSRGNLGRSRLDHRRVHGRAPGVAGRPPPRLALRHWPRCRPLVRLRAAGGIQPRLPRHPRAGEIAAR